MGDVAVEDVVNQVAENLTEAVTDGKKIPATPEGKIP